MSTGEIDRVSQFVSDNLTKNMYLNNRRYWNENGQFLHGNHHADVVALVKRALNTSAMLEIALLLREVGYRIINDDLACITLDGLKKRLDAVVAQLQQ